jgi:mannonate dehydratase
MMHVGGDYHSVMGGDIASKQNIEYNLRHGVKHLTAAVSKRLQGGWNADDLRRIQNSCQKFGVILEAIRMDSDYIRLRQGAERDREIDIIAGNIRKAADAGVKIITYDWEVVPYRRNGKTPGRGGTMCDAFKLETDWQSLPIGGAGRVTHDDYWERITYFLERIIPVAKENDVRRLVTLPIRQGCRLDTRELISGIHPPSSTRSNATKRLSAVPTMGFS